MVVRRYGFYLWAARTLHLWHLIFAILENLSKPSHLIFRVTKFSWFFSSCENFLQLVISQVRLLNIEWVRFCSHYLKIKSISLNHHVVFFLLYGPECFTIWPSCKPLIEASIHTTLLYIMAPLWHVPCVTSTSGILILLI